MLRLVRTCYDYRRYFTVFLVGVWAEGTLSSGRVCSGGEGLAWQTAPHPQ